MVVIARSALGWTIESPQPAGVTRPSPLAATGGNPRNLRYRTNDVADLLSGAAWYVHTGNAGQYDPYFVTEMHAARALSAQIGTNNSDHKAMTALDMNGSTHPWRQGYGMTKAKYDAHMAAAQHRHAHNVFRAVDKRLDMVRWCGEPWARADWIGYYEQHRDCMHWVVEEPNAAKIKAAADKMRKHFIPPRTTGEIANWQRWVGANPDTFWGQDSIRRMKAKQKALGLPQTGLPGDVATRKARSGASTLKKRKPRPCAVNKSSHPTVVKILQGLLRLTQDGSFGPKTEAATKAKQRALGVTPDGSFGPKSWKAYFKTIAVRKQGSTGWAVALIQYIGACSKIDRSFGPETDMAVKEMQSWAGLTPDGAFGPKSQDKLLI